MSGLVRRLVRSLGEDRTNSGDSRMESGLDCPPEGQGL